MQLVLEVPVQAPKSVVDKLHSLHHRTRTYFGRQYVIEADDDADTHVIARVELPSEPIKAWVITKSETNGDFEGLLRLIRRRQIPASYVDFARAKVASEGLVRDILITDKSFIRVDEDAGTSTIHIECNAEIDKHMAAVNDALSAIGADGMKPALLARIRRIGASGKKVE